jgi:hypothetical protein
MTRELPHFFYEVRLLLCQEIGGRGRRRRQHPGGAGLPTGAGAAEIIMGVLVTATHEIPRRGGALTAPMSGFSRDTFMNHKCFILEDEKSPLPPFSKGGY